MNAVGCKKILKLDEKHARQKKVTETQIVSVNLVVVGKNSSNKNETNVGLKGVIMSASKRVVPVNKKILARHRIIVRARVWHGIGARKHHWKIAHLGGQKADSG